MDRIATQRSAYRSAPCLSFGIDGVVVIPSRQRDLSIASLNGWTNRIPAKTTTI
ncbi:hypothetical protein ACEUZ9_001052 [Paracoccus litorisediminis]|uniref:hypothetical protein n=1 Tax=Paracoccus litorisediminis TaxID=2006130 RepID=UPI0037344C7D